MIPVRAMSNTSTKVFLLEVMGRHAGWLAASAGIIKTSEDSAPHLILLPEISFNQKKFLDKVKTTVNKYGYCVIVASEGIKNNKGEFIAASTTKDSFGHAHLGGMAPKLANMITEKLKIKVHWSVADYLQRAARHIASSVDVKQAYAIGKSAISYAKKGKSGVMLSIKSNNSKKFKWEISDVKLSNVANKEKKLPKSYISRDGFGITKLCKNYIENLVQGEDYPPYKNGIPNYAKLKHPLIKKKLKDF